MAEVETITGDLRAVAQLEEGTLQHWDELSRDQVADESLRKRGFYVADFPLYTAAGGKPTLYLARHTAEHPNNLVLVHLFDPENSSYGQLIQTGNFRPNPDEAQAVMDAADTLRMEMSGLRLSGNDTVYRSLRVRTKDSFVHVGVGKYERPNEVEQALIQRVGYTEEFLAVLGSKSHNVGETRVFLLNPDYVAAEVGELFVGRAAWRNNFNGGADSDALGHDVSSRSALRGVRRVEAARSADAPEKEQASVAPQEITLVDCYRRVLADPAQAVRALNDERAAGLSRIVADYLASRGQ